MRCPYCGYEQSKVMDSRFRKDTNMIRRRRECLSCTSRFTTREQIEQSLPRVIKKDGRREPFDSKKIMSGIERACEKLPVSIEQMEALVNQVEKHFAGVSESEVPSKQVGELVVQMLRDLHPVAYVRFASVYKSFGDVDDFMSELKEILNERKTPL